MAAAQVNTHAVHQCIEAVVRTAPSRYVLAPVLQTLRSSKYGIDTDGFPASGSQQHD